MEGIKKKSSAELKFFKQQKTDTGSPSKDSPESKVLQELNPPGPTASRIAELKALLLSVESPKEQWPGEALKAVTLKYARMPRNGWPVFSEIYFKLFGVEVSRDELKRLAEQSIVKLSGVRCSRAKFIKEASKRVKPIDVLIEENTLREAKVRNKARQQLRQELAAIKLLEVTKVEWTRKVSSEKLDLEILDAIIQETQPILAESPITSWTQAVQILQAVQHSYQKMTAKEKKQSTWQESILAKAEKARMSVKLLEKVKAREKLSPEETKEGRRIMRELDLVLERFDDIEQAIGLLGERALVYEEKLNSFARRKEFRKDNVCFELYRSKFYRQLACEPSAECLVEKEEVKTYWDTMWNKREDKNESYEEYLYDYVPPVEPVEMVFPSYEEFLDIVRVLPSWKAAGCDGIYNFFIKRCSPMHPTLYKLIRETCMGELKGEEWFYKGITYLLPKGTPTKGSDFRPITCMSNLYKLTTKCVTKVIQEMVEHRGLLAENQLGTVRLVQGAKEQAMINIALNKENKNSLKTAWIDVKKAFDSVDHSYLIDCIENLNLPCWISEFLKSTIDKWKLSIRYKNEQILEKRVERGILQGDSLSPLLFVLCMDPLSRRLNGKYPKLEVKLDKENYCSNHLLFIDDLKLFAENDDNLKEMMCETQKFFTSVGLEMNREKSATNSEPCESQAVVLNANEGYKYLGVTEDRDSKVTRVTYEKIRKEIVTRIESICKTKLNGKNSVKAINEYALSVVNYYVGLLPLEHQDYQEIDNEVRKILTLHGIHLQPANKERLYLPRKEMGRGIISVVHKSERMQLSLFRSLNASKNSSLRRAAILKTLKEENAPLALIELYLKEKYGFRDQFDDKSLVAAQIESLYSEIEKKTRHQKLYDARKNELVDIDASSTWLKHGNNRPQDEARFCYLQDRNMFGDKPGTCPHCKDRIRTVDHLATQCERMLYHDYMRRHNEIVRCIHLFLCNKYGIIRRKKLRSHSVQETVSNSEVTINVDTRVQTSIKVQANKPDIVVIDKKRKQITLIEIGITSQSQLKTVETEKKRKYDILANNMGQMHKMKTKIIPWVMTWDGIVTKLHRQYLKDLGINSTIEAYMQSVVIKKTLESVSLDYRRNEGTIEESQVEEMKLVEETRRMSL